MVEDQHLALILIHEVVAVDFELLINAIRQALDYGHVPMLSQVFIFTKDLHQILLLLVSHKQEFGLTVVDSRINFLFTLQDSFIKDGQNVRSIVNPNEIRWIEPSKRDEGCPSVYLIIRYNFEIGIFIATFWFKRFNEVRTMFRRSSILDSFQGFHAIRLIDQSFMVKQGR